MCGSRWPRYRAIDAFLDGWASAGEAAEAPFRSRRSFLLDFIQPTEKTDDFSKCLYFVDM
jgi:hypothetical protein